MKNIRFLMGLMMAVTAFVLTSAQVSAAEDSSNRLAKGALVGAGTNVIGGAVLDNLDGSSQAQPQYVQVQGPDGQPYWQQVGPAPQDPNKTILKRAVQGAITGAVAAHVAGDNSEKDSGGGAIESVASALSQDSSSDKEDADEDDENDDSGEGKKHKHKKSKGGSRPPGWDRGKKTGWGGGDVPPGHQEHDHEDHHGHDKD